MHEVVVAVVMVVVKVMVAVVVQCRWYDVSPEHSSKYRPIRYVSADTYRKNGVPRRIQADIPLRLKIARVSAESRYVSSAEFGRKKSIRNSLEDQFGSRNEPLCEEPCPTSTNAKLEMVREFLYRDCLVLPLIIGSSIDTVSCISFEASKNSTTVCEGYSDTNYSQYSVPPFDSSINGQKRKQPTEGTQYENLIQPKKKETDRDDRWSDDRTESNNYVVQTSLK
ncbi:unnamed protein product [Camellia sinensis]